MIQFLDLLTNIINKYKNNSNLNTLTKTRLLKIAYLIELKYYRKNKLRLTNEDWVYYKFGPYLFNYDNLLQKYPLINKNDNTESEFTNIDIDESFELPKLDIEITTIIGSVIKEYGDMDFNKLLDYIYFETEPMIVAEERGDKLDFSNAKTEDYFKIKSFKNPKDVMKIMKKKIKKR